MLLGGAGADTRTNAVLHDLTNASRNDTVHAAHRRSCSGWAVLCLATEIVGAAVAVRSQ